MPENPDAIPVLQPFFDLVYNAVNGPITWWRETVVEPNQKKYNWYHRKYNRVPTIDQCYTDDPVCQFEAHYQYLRDREVDSEILTILKNRAEHCMYYYGGQDYDGPKQCDHLWEIYEVNAGNWFTKYGDLGAYGTAKDAYMKQKHRLIWESRYGPVGSGMNPKKD